VLLLEANGGEKNFVIWTYCWIEEIGIERRDEAWKGGLSDPRMEIEGLPSCVGKGRETRGFFYKGKTLKVVFGCGKEFLRCSQ
jgi:hypothetical protein